MMSEGRPLRPSPTRGGGLGGGLGASGILFNQAVNHHRCHRRRPSRAGQTCSRRDLPWACSPARIWADPSSCSRSCLQTPRSPTLPLTALGRSCRPGVQGAGSGTGGLLSGARGLPPPSQTPLPLCTPAAELRHLKSQRQRLSALRTAMCLSGNDGGAHRRRKR